MSNYIYGKNAIREALLAQTIEELLLVSKAGFEEYINKALNNKCTISYVSNETLIKLAGTTKHQGIVAKKKEEYKYYVLDELLANNNPLFKNPLLIILDGLEDPHNLGAVLRSADAFGANGVIIPKHRSVRLNETVSKVSTGAIEYVKVCEVTNLTQTINTLKDKGFWIVGAEYKEDAQKYDEIDYNMPIALVIGSEGKGISKLVLEQCDFVAYIPMVGHVNSLNASVSCAIMLSEINKRRK